MHVAAFYGKVRLLLQYHAKQTLVVAARAIGESDSCKHLKLPDLIEMLVIFSIILSSTIYVSVIYLFLVIVCDTKLYFVSFSKIMYIIRCKSFGLEKFCSFCRSIGGLNCKAFPVK